MSESSQVDMFSESDHEDELNEAIRRSMHNLPPGPSYQCPSDEVLTQLEKDDDDGDRSSNTS